MRNMMRNCVQICCCVLLCVASLVHGQGGIAALGDGSHKGPEGCEDLSKSCEGWGARGECEINPAYMLANCPKTCDSCLPQSPEECIDRDDSLSCYLEATLGMCRTNPSYALRFCSGSCRDFIDACGPPGTRDIRSCTGPQSITQPDFDCGRVAGVLSRQGLPVSDAGGGGRGRGRGGGRGGSGNLIFEIVKSSRQKKWNRKPRKQSFKHGLKNPPHEKKDLADGLLKEVVERAKGRQFTDEKKDLADGLLKEVVERAKGRQFTDEKKDLADGLLKEVVERAKGRQFADDSSVEDTSPWIWGFPIVVPFVIPIFLIYLYFYGLCIPPAVTTTPPPLIILLPTPPTPPLITPVIKTTTTTTIITATRTITFPPPPQESGAARALVPNCEARGYLDLVSELEVLVRRHTGRPLNPRAFMLVEAILYCRHGTAEAPPELARPIFRRGGPAHLTRPQAWPGVSYPGLFLHDNTTEDSAIPSVATPERVLGQAAGSLGPSVALPSRRRPPRQIPDGEVVYSDGEALPGFPPFFVDGVGVPSVTSALPAAGGSFGFITPGGGVGDTALTTGGISPSVGDAFGLIPPGAGVADIAPSTDGISPSAGDPFGFIPPVIGVADTPPLTGGSSPPVELPIGPIPPGGTAIPPPASPPGGEEGLVLPPAPREGEGIEGDEGEEDEEETDGPDGPVPVTDGNDRKRFFCGGSLVTPRHILTAAHCVADRAPEVIRLGERDFTRTSESQALDYKVERVTKHKDYNFIQNYNDIAVIELQDKVQFNPFVQPYCLPPEKVDLDGRTCSVSGWGSRPNEFASSLLITLDVEVMTNEECNQLYSEAGQVFKVKYPEGFDDTLLCAGGGPGKDVCRGDSGGPLILIDTAHSEKIVGVVSSGYGCGDPRYPGIYTRADGYLEWLDHVIYGVCAKASYRASVGRAEDGT